MKHLDQTDVDCMIEMRNACAACFRVLARNELAPQVELELEHSGVKKEFGMRFQELIDRKTSNEYVKFVIEDKLNEIP